ncbi:hypothetical protein LTS18_002766, partial [Coniosporium uncinatum]
MLRRLFLGATVLAAAIVVVDAQIVQPHLPKAIVGEKAEEVALKAEGCDKACASLTSKFPEQVFLGKSGNFDLWDAKQDLAPACRAEPASAEDVRVVLEAVKEAQCHFAVKSGGHARFAGASNAEGGVTIDLVRLDEIRLSSDKKSVTIGAGNRWMEIYRALEAEGLTVVGGRVADVGVGGLLLGGGISFFSGRHGLACDSILSYEVVLPSGAIATASEDERPDLFKALKGAGSSNFGIVTSFTLETISLPNKDGLWIDYCTYSWDKVPALNKARTEWMTSGVEEDVDFGGFDIFVHVGIYNMTLAITNHIHTSHLSISEYPDIFKQYGDIETLPDAAPKRIMPMSNITQEITALNPHGL